MTKSDPENCKNCSSKCAYDCAQLQYTIQHDGTAGILQTFQFKGQRSRLQDQKSRSQPNVTNVSAVKRYKASPDRSSDFKLGMGVVIKADNY